MEEIKEFEDAWEGDLINYKGKCYRVINADIVEGGHIKRMKVVNLNPLFSFTRVKTIYL